MKNKICVLSALCMLSSISFAEQQHPTVPTKERDLIFKAAGFKKVNGAWLGNCDTGQITMYKDLNGDGLSDAVISDSSSSCYGRTGVGYYLMAQTTKGTWKKIFENSGAPTFLETKGKDGWPDIHNLGAGFCFAVYRWDAKTYDVNRYEYEGKSCTLF